METRYAVGYYIGTVPILQGERCDDEEWWEKCTFPTVEETREDVANKTYPYCIIEVTIGGGICPHAKLVTNP